MYFIIISYASFVIINMKISLKKEGDVENWKMYSGSLGGRYVQEYTVYR